MIRIISKKKIEFSLFLILILALFLRFVNYPNRWGLAYDQARDVIIATYAFNNHLIPLIGPFAASGPFVFGPYMYWIYIFVTSFFPSSILLLWVFVTAFSAFMSLVMYLIGVEIKDKNFGLLLAFLAAISTARVTQSTDLTYSTFVGIVSAFVFLFTIRAIKRRREIYFFLLALLVGLAVNIHFQAIGLIFIFLILPFFTKLSIKKILLIILGFIIPFVPLVIFDFNSNHYESMHLISYFLSRGNALSEPKRWLTYIGIFWPNTFSDIIGGYSPLGYFLVLVMLSAVVIAFWTHRVFKITLFSLIFFLLNFIALRYYRGMIYDAFLVYLRPVIIILIGGSIRIVRRKSFLVASIILLVIAFFTVFRDSREIISSTNITARYSEKYVNELSNKYHGQKFSFYDYNFKSIQRSFPTVMFFMKRNLISDNGRKMGFISATNSADLNQYKAPVVTGKFGDYFILDLSRYNKQPLEQRGWVFINPSEIYKSTEDWYKNK